MRTANMDHSFLGTVPLATLKAERHSILLINKSLVAVMRLADAAGVLEKGRSVWTGTTAELAAAPAIRDTYLHI